MTEIVSQPQEQQAQTAQQPEAQSVAQEQQGTAERHSHRGDGRRGGGRGSNAAKSAQATQPQQAARPANPLLEQLAQWHPALFGEQLLPFKRGIFEDLLAAHPELDKEALKSALQQHTRSGRYLAAMASGQQRHDLSGQPVEATLPEHVHHALIEVFRRRQQRTQEDLTPKLRNRIALAYEASGLTREEYAERVLGKNEATNTLVAEALAEADARAAKDEALLRSFQLSGQSSEQEFAEMYGMNPRQVAQQLERARRRQQKTQ
ncbi:MAG: ProQ/FinO family protein [Comamonas sp.]|jgi:sRNA-binding protein|nr:ProQ/FinO family protein [Comamonas sp.]